MLFAYAQGTLHFFFRTDKKYPVHFFTCFIQGFQLPVVGAVGITDKGEGGIKPINASVPFT
jgi:hypothetical protein